MHARCDDVDVAWFEAGRGDPLVLVHGLGDDHRAWRRAVPDLMLRHRVLLYDLRGHGQTTLGKPDGSLRQLGQDLVALLDALDVARARIAGFSRGAAMAALFEAPLDPELGQIKAPALIVASDLDQHCPPKAAEIIQSGIPGSRIEILKGAGHAIPVERPRELAAAINKFFS